jgi:phage regulator Rha-like protein
MSPVPVLVERIERAILFLRGHKVMLDSDLAALYGVETRVLVQAVKRNPERFPKDFMFRLTNQELENWRSQIVMSNPGAMMGLRRPPYAFTEHGALMAATVLNSPRAVEMSLYVVRAFVRMREVLATHKELAKKLEALEKKTEALALKHDALATTTRAQFKEVIEALRALMTPPEPKKRPIGFVTPEEK